MKALNQIAPIAVLLSALAALPVTWVAFRQLVGEVAATIPRHGSALEAAEFWTRAFGP